MRKLLFSILTILCLCATMAFVSCETVPDTSGDSTPEPSVTYTVTVTVNNEEYGTVSKALVENVVAGTAIGVDGATITIGDETITATPAEATAKYAYSFTEWTVAETVTDNITVTANFKRDIVTYTVTFKNIDGTVLDASEWAYGETPSYEGTPTMGNDANYIYGEFTGWDAEIGEVESDVVYTATYNNKVANPYGYMHAILYQATNAGAGIEFDDENGTAAATASADNMYIYLDHEAVSSYGANKEYLKIVVSSPAGASFVIVPMVYENSPEYGEEIGEARDGNWSYYPFVSVYDSETFYIPMNDDEVQDWENYDVRLYIGYATQTIVIEEISFVNVADMQIVSKVTGGSADGNVYTATGVMYVTLDHNVINLKSAGKDYLKLTLKGSPTEFNILPVDSTGTEDWHYVYVTLWGEDTVFYVPLNDKDIHDFSKYDLKLVVRAGQSVTISGLEFKTTAERIAETPVVSQVKKGDLDGNTCVATSSLMEVYINHEYVNLLGDGKDFLKLTLTGSPSELYIGTNNGSDQPYGFGKYNITYVHTTLFSNKTFYIPLKDETLHKWSSYDLLLMTGAAGQNITIDEIKFETMEERLGGIKLVSGVTGGTEEEGVYTATDSLMYIAINREYVNLAGEGKKYLKLTLKNEGAGVELNIIAMNSEGTENWSFVWTGLMGTDVFYVPLDDVDVHDWSKYDLRLTAHNGQALSIVNVEFTDTNE